MLPPFSCANLSWSLSLSELQENKAGNDHPTWLLRAGPENVYVRLPPLLCARLTRQLLVMSLDISGAEEGVSWGAASCGFGWLCGCLAGLGQVLDLPGPQCHCELL